MAKKEFSRDKITVKSEAFLTQLSEGLSDGLSLETVIKRFQNLLPHYPADAEVMMDGYELLIRWKRLETDSEQARRIKRHEARTESRKSAEKKRHAANVKRLDTLKKQVAELEATLHPTA